MMPYNMPTPKVIRWFIRVAVLCFMFWTVSAFALGAWLF